MSNTNVPSKIDEIFDRVTNRLLDKMEDGSDIKETYLELFGTQLDKFDMFGKLFVLTTFPVDTLLNEKEIESHNKDIILLAMISNCGYNRN